MFDAVDDAGDKMVVVAVLFVDVVPGLCLKLLMMLWMNWLLLVLLFLYLGYV